MDWLFLFQVFLVVLVWLLARYFYRHSGWLHSNKPITIPIHRFPGVISIIEKLLNKNDIFLYVVLVPISLATILGGLFLLMLLGKGAFHEFESFLNSQTWWGQLLIWACFILCYFGVRVWLDGKKGKSFLSSNKENVSSYRTKNIPQKATEIDAIRIPTYPRFTIYDLSVEEREQQLIFDSSDFLVISKAFGLLDGLNYNTILTEQYLKFKGEEYLVTKVQVDFLDIFDDYSINPFGGRHTKVYEGRDVPYNIQIIVETTRKHV